MTPLPKRRISTYRSSKRKRSRVLAKNALIKCQKCGHVMKQHTVCPNCGFYKNRQALTIKIKTKKSEAQ